MAKRGQSKYMTHMRAKAIAGQMGAHRHSSDVVSQHEAMIKKAHGNVHKGLRGGDCNRTQCQRSQAWWYNKTMNAFYCGDCARAINESCLTRDHVATFKDMIYVKPPTATITRSEEQYTITIETADGDVSLHTEFVSEEQAETWLRSFYMYADLRTDGSAPFHYSELPEKMERIRKFIEEKA